LEERLAEQASPQRAVLAPLAQVAWERRAVEQEASECELAAEQGLATLELAVFVPAQARAFSR
jgi:hypothetical protein